MPLPTLAGAMRTQARQRAFPQTRRQLPTLAGAMRTGCRTIAYLRLHPVANPRRGDEDVLAPCRCTRIPGVDVANPRRGDEDTSRHSVT